MKAHWNRLVLAIAGGRVWRMWEHDDWGNSLRWFRIPSRVMGHLTPLPEVNDEIRAGMSSGKVGRYRIVKVDPCYDPPDQFFATVSWAGYERDGGNVRN